MSWRDAFCQQYEAVIVVTRPARAPAPWKCRCVARYMKKKPINIVTIVRFMSVLNNLVKEQITPPIMPTTIPATIFIGPSRALMVLSWPVLMAIPMQILYPEIATTSSKDAAATTREGIPLAIPNPLFCRSNMPDTTTAGDTAARIKPRDIPSAIGIPQMP